MTEAELRERVTRWDIFGTPSEEPADSSRFTRMMAQIDYFAGSEWVQYLPAEHPDYDRNYLTRLARWLGKLEHEEDQQLLLEYALHISFFSHADMCALFHSTFTGPVLRWVVTQANIKLDTADLNDVIEQELRRATWFCPITDSLKINDFYKVNKISGIGFRPSFAELRELITDQASSDNTLKQLRKYMEVKGLRRLVLLEDFVGSGNQVSPALAWTIANLGVPILFVALITCPEGAKFARELSKRYSDSFAFASVVDVQQNDLLGPRRETGIFCTISLTDRLENLAKRIFPQVAGSSAPKLKVEPFTPFGFLETGCSVVKYDNAPDNSLPMIHHTPKSGTWIALFPRTPRLE
jgi:hypothetical protein